MFERLREYLADVLQGLAEAIRRLADHVRPSSPDEWRAKFGVDALDDIERTPSEVREEIRSLNERMDTEAIARAATREPLSTGVWGYEAYFRCGECDSEFESIGGLSHGEMHTCRECGTTWRLRFQRMLDE